MRPDPQSVSHVVYLPKSQTTPSPTWPAENPSPSPDPGAVASAARESWSGENGYYKLQQHVLRWGFDGLPQPAPAPPPETLEAFLKSL